VKFRKPQFLIKNMRNTIEFTCWENDKALEIQLEPEAVRYIVHPEQTLKFVAPFAKEGFSWALRINHEDKSVQLFPEGLKYYGDIEVYRNNELVIDPDYYE
jgi:hypothetical protein